MAHIHLILQGKGGVGKSLIASLIAQYKLSKGRRPLCIDTDPVNASFEAYKSLKVSRLSIVQNEEIDPRSFDQLIEQIAKAKDKDEVIIDNGASSFVPLSAYVLTHHVPALLRDLGHQLIVHTVVTGGQALMKNPALTGGVSLQFKLRLTRLLLALVLDIVPNRGLVDAHRGGEKSSCPDPATIPIHFAQDVREFLFQLPAGHAFQGLHHS